MHFVYILRSQKENWIYVGYTIDIERRLAEYQSGKVVSTKTRRPFHVLMYEAYQNEIDARRRETYLKTTKGKTTLRIMLQETLRDQH